METTGNGTAQAWRERIGAQRDSGQSIRAWCRENNHHEHAFYWWRKRLGLSPRLVAKRPQRCKLAKFTEVVVHSPPEPVRLRLSGERELILPASMPVTLIAQLVRAIEGKSSAVEGVA